MLRAVFLFALSLLLPAPLLAAQAAAKRPPCQQVRNPLRDAKRIEPCRRATPIPPVVDPTPSFSLASLTVAG